MMTKAHFEKIVRSLQGHFPAEYDECMSFEDMRPPRTAEAFASETIYVICASGFKASIAQGLHTRCMQALKKGRSSSTVFGHIGKTKAIDEVWRERARYFAEFKRATDLNFFETLPFIGPITKKHLAKNCGFDVCKDDIWLQRLAKAFGTTPHRLCENLAKITGYKVSTVDSILWEACRNGIVRAKDGFRAVAS